jgi:hypothetical protein
VQSWTEDQLETCSALRTGYAGLRMIITRRKRGDSGASDSDKCVFPNDCTLEAMRTQGKSR